MDGRTVEIGVDHLAMVEQEAAALLRQAGAKVSTAEADELVKRTEGCPAGKRSWHAAGRKPGLPCR